MIVCLHMCVSLFMCQSFDLQLIFCCFMLLSETPLLFLSPTMLCCLYQAAQELVQRWDVKLPSSLSPPLSIFLSLPFSPPICCLEALSQLLLFSVICCLFLFKLVRVPGLVSWSVYISWIHLILPSEQDK